MKIFKYLMFSLFTAIGVVGFSGCGDDITQYYGSEVITRDYQVKKTQWSWNPVYNRYECTMKVPEINERLYEYGTIVGTVYIVEEDDQGVTYEVQKNLPFVQSYKNAVVPYTEVVSFDIFYGNGSNPSITFYIQTSDGLSGTPFLPENCYFKLALIWDSET